LGGLLGLGLGSDLAFFAGWESGSASSRARFGCLGAFGAWDC